MIGLGGSGEVADDVDLRDYLRDKVRIHRLGTSRSTDLVGTLTRAQETCFDATAPSAWQVTVEEQGVPRHVQLQGGRFTIEESR